LKSYIIYTCALTVLKNATNFFFQLVVQGVFGDDSQVFAYYS
jgi:hypothetical protein